MKKLLSKDMIKQSIRNNWKLWAILTGILCLFISIITFVTNTDRGENGGFPGGGGGGGGFGQMGLLGAYSNMFFGMMGLILMMIYAIAVGNKLVASEIDKGTMSFTLNTPTTRKQIIFSKALFYIVSLIAMAVLMGLFATVSSLIAGAELAYGTFWLMILGFILFSLAVSGICFAASCWFNKSGQSLMLGAGLPVAFWLLSTLSGMNDSLEFLKYFSMNSLFDTSAIIAGTGFAVGFIVLGVIAAICYTVGINKFLKKDLPL